MVAGAADVVVVSATVAALGVVGGWAFGGDAHPDSTAAPVNAAAKDSPIPVCDTAVSVREFWPGLWMVPVPVPVPQPELVPELAPQRLTAPPGPEAAVAGAAG